MDSKQRLLVTTLAGLAALGSGCQLEPWVPGSAVRSQPRYLHATWGVCAVDLTTGETLAALDAERLLAPASTAKLFSVAAGLQDLGPGFRSETTVHQLGTLQQDGRLRGALILRAGGDLTLGGRDAGDGTLAISPSDHIYSRSNPRTVLTKPSPVAGLRALAEQAYAAGVRDVEDVFVDARSFQPFPSSGSGPKVVWPIAINDNLVDFVIRPTAPGQLASVRPRPASQHYRISSKIETTRGGSFAVRIRSPRPGQFELVGTIPVRHPPQVESVAVANPPAFVRLLWIEELTRHGIRVSGPRRWHNPEELLPAVGVQNLPILARLRSAPFAEQARLTLKVSHNLHASAVPMLMALQRGSRDHLDGMRAMRRALRDLGLDPAKTSLAGGAGGHDADRTSARATVALLQAVATRPFYQAFRRALPILGVDGTLTNTGSTSPARGQVLAKTGSLYTYDALNGRRILTAKALAGYLKARSGRQVTFAILANNILFDAETTLEAVGEDLAEIATELFERF